VLARQIATLDHLSRGRLTVGVGLGDNGWREFSAFGDEADPAARGQILDESLDLLKSLLGGEAVTHHDTKYSVEAPAFLPTPLQSPVPIWGACIWPHRRPLRRAAWKLQGVFPLWQGPLPPKPPTTAEIEAVRQATDKMGAPAGFDVVVRFPFGLENPDELPVTLGRLAEAGATWVLNSFGYDDPPPEILEEIVKSGPPALS
jgi:alkanesulfonate monooxygenase SsuD/methylene tetrahydromethanopterin reductase-like flavin-dependent oxidoreductase (luciferase family)